MATISCPECAATIEVAEDVMIGEIVDCIDCGQELEIISVDGSNIQARIAESEGEDFGE